MCGARQMHRKRTMREAERCRSWSRTDSASGDAANLISGTSLPCKAHDPNEQYVEYLVYAFTVAGTNAPACTLCPVYTVAEGLLHDDVDVTLDSLAMRGRALLQMLACHPQVARH